MKKKKNSQIKKVIAKEKKIKTKLVENKSSNNWERERNSSKSRKNSSAHESK